MARKKKKKARPAPNRPTVEPGPLAHNPFAALKNVDLAPEPVPVPEKKPKKTPEPVAPNDERLFLDAMSDVRPIRRANSRITGPAPAPKKPEPVETTDDDEALAHLQDLVAGKAQFDILDSDEYLEGHIHGLRPKILDKLRRGRFSVQAYLDLHGLTVAEAEVEVRDFIVQSVTLGHRCVLLVHGRGLNSKEKIPVLKKKLDKILLSGPTRKHILAFTTARPHDGGGGASYVLLRGKV